MKYIKINHIITLLLLITSQLSFGQILNGDFESGPVTNQGNEVAEGWFVNDNSPNAAHTSDPFRIFTTLGSSYSTVSRSPSLHHGIVSTGNFLFIDGIPYGTAPVIAVYQSGITIPPSISSITFDAAERSGSNVMVKVFLNGNDLGQVNITNTMTNYSLPLGTYATPGATNTISFAQVTFNVHNGDFGIDNVELICDPLSNPVFKINGSPANSTTICDIEDLKLNIDLAPTATNYHVEIRNTITGDVHSRWLTPGEINAGNLSNFDLYNFANTTAQAGMNGPTSNSIDLIGGHCYEVKVASQNECTNWAATIRTFCVEGQCSAESFITTQGECNPIQFIAAGTNGGNYMWDFGDGTSSSLPNPVHQYAQPGMYNITLITYNTTACGTCCNVSTMSILVDCGEFTGETLTWVGEGGEFKTDGSLIQSADPSNNDLKQLNVYPNPSTESTSLSFTVENEEYVSLRMYNGSGVLISTLINNEIMNPGQQSIEIQTSDLPAGIYHLVLTNAEGTTTTPLVVNK